MGTFVNAIIFNGYRIGQLVISQKFAVSVKNAASCTGSDAFFLNQHRIIIKVFFSIDNLKDKNPLYQYCK